MNDKILIRNPHHTKEGGDSSSIGSHRIPVTCFSIDQELIYWNFFLDFGPLNLGQLYRFSVKLNTLLAQTKKNNNVNGTEADGAVLFYSSTEDTKRANAIFLICAWQVLQLHRTPEEAFYGFQTPQNQQHQSQQYQQQAYQGAWCHPDDHYCNNDDDNDEDDDYDMVSSTCCVDSYHYESSSQQQQQQQQHSSFSSTNNQSSNHTHNRSHPPIYPLSIIGKHTIDTNLPAFHDASPYVCSYDLTILDCLTALMKAKQYQFFDWELSSSSSNNNNNGNLSYNNYNNNNGGAKFDIQEYEYFEQVEVRTQYIYIYIYMHIWFLLPVTRRLKMRMCYCRIRNNTNANIFLTPSLFLSQFTLILFIHKIYTIILLLFLTLSYTNIDISIL